MAGVRFSFNDIIPLITLNIGFAKRIDDNRAESMSILYCNFADFSQELISSSLEQFLRLSDAVVNYENHYFFLLPYTDKYGAMIVKDMFEEFFAIYIESYITSYPIDGENAFELLEDIQTMVSKNFSADLLFLDKERLIGN